MCFLHLKCLSVFKLYPNLSIFLTVEAVAALGNKVVETLRTQDPSEGNWTVSLSFSQFRTFKWRIQTVTCSLTLTSSFFSCEVDPVQSF